MSISLVTEYRNLLEEFVGFDFSSDEFVYEDLPELKKLKIRAKEILKKYKPNVIAVYEVS